ncbi:FmdB family zinc ribbon protein [Rhizobium sp. YIM 134829]|uniref:FmdB family zinc ribbon protein n=1 Tax=Rhizobium sp. YIM 134829 TaxID=3390453 RepID=UPI00397D9EA3
MPTYDYRCPHCGPFTAMRPLAAFRDPQACPTCNAMAARDLLSAPALAGIDLPWRSGVNASGRRDESGRPAAQGAHPIGCGCCARRSPIPAALVSKGRVFASSGPLRRSGQ